MRYTDEAAGAGYTFTHSPLQAASNQPPVNMVIAKLDINIIKSIFVPLYPFSLRVESGAI